MKVVLYTTHCPQCEILKKQLTHRSITFEEVEDVDVMIEKGFTKVPMLEVDEKLMNFSEANRWMDELKK